MASSGRDISGVPSRDDERNQTIRSQFEDYEDSTTGNEDGNEDDSEASHSTAGTSNVNVNVARTYAPPSEGDGELVPYGRGNEEDSGLSGTIPEGEEVHRFETQRGVLYETEGYDYDDDQQSTGSYETTDTGYSSIPAHAYNDEESTTPSLNTTTTGYSSIPAHAYNDEEASTAQSLNTTATGNSSIPTHAYNDEESLAGQSQSTIATTATATSLLGTALLGSSSSHSTGYAEHTQHSRRSIGLAQVAEEEDELSDVMEPNPQATEGRLVVRQMTPERQRGEEGGETAQSGDSSSQRTSVDSSVERSLVLVEPEPLSRQQQGRTAAGRRVRKTKVTTVPEGDSSTSYVDDTSESTSTTQTSKDFFDLALPQSEKADMQEASSTEGRLTHKSSHSAKSSYGLASTFETVDSNRSAGWSRYDDDVSMDSKNQFFERGLPMSAEDQAAWEKDIAEAERAADNAAQQRRSADEESLGIDTTIAGEHNSGESRGVDQQQGYYEDDATIQSTGPNYWNSRFSSNFGRPETIYEGSVETESHATPSIAPSRQSSTKSGSTKSRASTYASRESASTRESSMRPTDPPSIQDGYSAQDDYESVQGDESYVSDGDYSRASSLHKPRMSTYSTYSSYSQSKRSSRYDYRASDSRSLAGRSMTEESMRSMTSRSVGADSFGAGSRPSTASGSTGPSIMGMVQRPTTSREQRRFMSREVEVSMDGFMHQAKPPTSSNISSTLQDYPYIAIPNGAGGGRAPWDKSSSSLSNRIATISSLLFLVATAIFFAAHVGPFVVQPPIATTRNSQGGGSSQSSAFLANGGNGTDPNAPGTVVADVTTATSPLVPDFILGKFLNWRVPYTDITTELPVLFTYGKSGGEIAAHAFGQCLAKVNAGNGRDFDPNLVHTADFTAEQLLVISLGGLLYVNVDLFSVPGIDRAERLNLAPARVSDFAYTGMLAQSSRLFLPPTGSDVPIVWGRLMVMFRDPIERALNRFEEFKIVTGNTAYTLSQYANSPLYAENNPLMRSLVGLGPNDALDQSHSITAQAIIDNHIVVGLFDRFEESMDRFERFIQWRAVDVPGVDDCRAQVMETYRMGYNITVDYTQQDPLGYNLIVAAHRYDKLLFNYAVATFDLQATALVFN